MRFALQKFGSSLASLFLLSGLLLSPCVGRAVSMKQLPPTYRKWIEQTVPYIITEEEKNAFLELKTDEARDRFMTQFWEDRNPDPHATLNLYKEEYYQRLAYVREHFGDDRYDDGWRTDMGRVYITLGPPQQTAKYHSDGTTRPTEIWFYQSPSPALPLYFNLVFYKRSPSEPYTLYSPRQDGPQRVVTNDVHDDAQCLRIIKDAMGSEAEHAMVSLLPSEPVDVKHPDPSMLSEVLLDQVRNLADQKLEKDRILRQRQRSRESTSFSILTGAHSSTLQAVVLRDRDGQSTIHYMVRNEQPDAALIGTLADGRTGYRMTLRTRVLTSEGKALYVREEKLTGAVSATGAKAGKEKVFGAEGRLPVVPGGYVLESTLINELTHESTRATRAVAVPLVHGDGPAVSNLLAYRGSPGRDPDGQLPFAIAAVRFAPRGEQTVELNVGEKLPLVYQVWLPKADATAAPTETPKQLHVSYVVGAVAQTAGQRVEETEDIPVKSVDAAGNLLTGRTLDTSALGPGIYRLVMRVKEDGASTAAYATMSVRIVPTSVPAAMWTAFSNEGDRPLWQDAFLRGLSAEVQGNPLEAETFYHKALALDPNAGDAQMHLDALNKKLAQSK